MNGLSDVHSKIKNKIFAATGRCYIYVSQLSKIEQNCESCPASDEFDWIRLLITDSYAQRADGTIKARPF